MAKRVGEDHKEIKDKTGAELFEKFYRDLFGESWPELRAQLLKPAQKTNLISPWSGQLPDYELDPASLLVAESLLIKTGDRFLDLCSAPGGKALAVIARVAGQGEFHLNDLSIERVSRLKRVVREHVPKEYQTQIRITRGDGMRFGIKAQDQYDCVLLDAPCSGERHLLQSPRDLAQWTPTRSRRLAQRQYGLLCAAMLAARPGGLVVYSTCSLNPVENDEVIERFFERKAGVATVEPMSESQGLPTRYGRLIRPDLHSGWGPMYWCALRKNV